MTDRTLYEVIGAVVPDRRKGHEGEITAKVVPAVPCVHGNVFPHDVPSESLAGVAECDGKPKADFAFASVHTVMRYEAKERVEYLREMRSDRCSPDCGFHPNTLEERLLKAFAEGLLEFPQEADDE